MGIIERINADFKKTLARTDPSAQMDSLTQQMKEKDSPAKKERKSPTLIHLETTRRVQTKNIPKPWKT